MQGYLAHHQIAPAAIDFWTRFQQQIWLSFQQYRVPTIKLTHDTPREAVCQVFEKVNTGGVTLTVFELCTTTLAAEEFDLREDWDRRYQRITDKRPVLGRIEGTAFLTALTLLSSFRRSAADGRPVSCKRADVLRLDKEVYQSYAPEIEKGFSKAAEILAEYKIFDVATLPYAAQIVPLAAICAQLSKRVDAHAVKVKLMRWFWCGVFGELYGSANETRFALDLPEVVRWIDADVEPRTVADATFAPTRLLTMQSRLSAAYKGLTALLMSRGSCDLITGTPIDLAAYFDRAIDIHHIFPRDWCTKHGLPSGKWNSIVNKAPLAAETNRFLGGNAPSHFLGRITENRGVTTDKLNEFLSSHEADPAILRLDDFDGFLRDRAGRLLNLIERATGKQVAGRDSEETMRTFGASI
jgi:hypothetical protein